MNMSVIVDLQIATSMENIPSQKQIAHWVTTAVQNFQTRAEITIRIVTAEESRILNNTYRNKNNPTNVLSFPFESPIDLDVPLLGDLVICKAIVEKEAREQQKPLLNHWAHLIVHGILHLLGYDHIESTHAAEMETLEINIMKSLGFTNPYQDDENK